MSPQNPEFSDFWIFGCRFQSQPASPRKCRPKIQNSAISGFSGVVFRASQPLPENVAPKSRIQRFLDFRVSFSEPASLSQKMSPRNPEFSDFWIFGCRFQSQPASPRKCRPEIQNSAISGFSGVVFRASQPLPENVAPKSRIQRFLDFRVSFSEPAS